MRELIKFLSEAKRNKEYEIADYLVKNHAGERLPDWAILKASGLKQADSEYLARIRKLFYIIKHKEK